ncbi:MAG: Trm112 family protein [Paracoccaceae bacterium]
MTGDEGAESYQPASTPPTSPRLLETLVCPSTGGRLIYDAERQELLSKSANLAYPIRQGIPIMLVDEARTLED